MTPLYNMISHVLRGWEWDWDDYGMALDRSLTYRKQTENARDKVKGRFRPWSSDLLLFSITIRLHLTRRVLKFGQRFARKRFLMIKIYHIDVSRHLRANLTSCRQDEVLRSQTLQMVTISNVLFTTTNQSLCFCIWFTSQYEAHKQWLTQK